MNEQNSEIELSVNEHYMEMIKKQGQWMKITALCMLGTFVVLLATALILVPRTTRVLTNAEKTLEEADLAVQDLAKTATQLSQVDFEGLVSDTGELIDDTQDLVANSATGIDEAIAKLNAIDIDGLNQAIEDLGAVVSPLARLFGN